jgi:flagellar motility protein MotE (MotC chaperone)
MNGFIRTLAYGLAAMCIVLLVAGITAISTLRANGKLNAKALRPLVLTAEERAWLAEMHNRPSEPAEIPVEPPSNERELLAHIAEMAGAAHANQLMTRLRRQQEALDERQVHLDQQWADLQLAKAGLERLQRQVQDQERVLADQAKSQAEEHARWAAAQASEVQRMQVMAEVEKARYRDQAKLFEQMKDNAWQSLRRFTPREIARYLALMDPKKASRLLVLAQQDTEYPSVAVAIHQEMLRIDLEAATGTQVQRLATLYSFMPAERIVPYLDNASPQEVADILVAMEANTPSKKRAELMEALRRQDSRREQDIRALIERARKPDPGAGAQ